MAKLYKTKSGDVWDKIAKTVYGNESYTSFLMQNNTNLLDYFVFPQGIDVLIEDKPANESYLPEWRK
ncbi:MAG: phage tail protein [Lachnospiraceae bacterium]|nr:phage tail protein [Lachnospiraceae bacterium]